MTKNSEWFQIMEGLRGNRLGLLDNIARGEPFDVNNTKVQECLGWLVFYRFVWHDGRSYVARPTPEARDLYLKQGSANEAAAAVTRLQHETPAPEAAPHPAPRPDAVHAHQAQFFSNV